MVRAVGAGLLVAFVVWGWRAEPGKPFSWAMFSGSSKGFLFAGTGESQRIPTFEELRLAPDSHYLLLPDLGALMAEPTAPQPLDGLIVGTRGSWAVELEDHEQGPVVRQLRPGEDMTQLVNALRQLPWPPK